MIHNNDELIKLLQTRIDDVYKYIDSSIKSLTTYLEDVNDRLDKIEELLRARNGSIVQHNKAITGLEYNYKALNDKIKQRERYLDKIKWLFWSSIAVLLTSVVSNIILWLVIGK